MDRQRILVVDDDTALLEVLDLALAEEGFDVVTATDAASAESLLASGSPDLVILDVMLPDKSGLEIARDLRAHSSLPIVILSARDAEVDRVLGLELGADDYVTKPFSTRELTSRVKTLLRRVAACRQEHVAVTVVGDLKVDPAARQVKLADAPVELTASEYDILVHLASSPGTAFSRHDILAAAGRNGDGGDERTVDVHVHNIREKIEPDAERPSYILTVRGFGYRLRES